MRQKALMILPALGLSLVAAFALASQSGAPRPNRLVTAKIIYVEPMPDHLDQWLIQDLRTWGKYQISSTEAGVDLVMRARKPEDKVHFTRSQVPPVLRRQHQAPPVLSVTVVDWVTGNKMWQADVLDVSPKKNQAPRPGPNTEIAAKHMKPDQIAERCTNLLRRYVEEIEQAPPQQP